MAVNIFSPVFKFASIRNPKPMKSDPNIISVMPETLLIKQIVLINENDFPNDKKVNDINALLENFINSEQFIKTTSEFYSIFNIDESREEDLRLMYDNLIIRLLTKSNTNEVYGLLLKYIKKIAATLNTVSEDKIKILIPERITFPFTQFEGINEYNPPQDESTEIVDAIVTLTEAKKKIIEAKENNIIKISSNNQVTKRNVPFLPLLQYYRSSTIIVSDAETDLNDKIQTLTDRVANENNPPDTNDPSGENTSPEASKDSSVDNFFHQIEYHKQLKKLIQLANEQNLTEINENEIFTDDSYNTILSALEVTEITVEAAEKKIDAMQKKLYKQTDKLVPGRTYSLIGQGWKEITAIVNPGFVVEDEIGTSITVHTQGCHLKYPVQVADLRVVEQQTVGYLPAEIAHIDNTQRGEKNTRVTRRLKKVETYESFIQENELTKETDTQSTERFGIENEAYEVQQEESAWNVNASVSASYGPVSATVNSGYSSGSEELSGNNSSQQYAKEIFTRIIDRVSNRIRVERSVLTVEEFEETVTHEIDNSTQETKSYVYRWLNKLVRGTLKNYGKRLIFELQVAHPSSYYISRMIKEKPVINIPDDPRELFIGGIKFNPQMIDQNNYIEFGTRYKTKLEAPPESKIIVSEVFNSTTDSVYQGKLIPIKKGYACKKAVITNAYNTNDNGNHIAYMIGNACFAYFESGSDFWEPRTLWLANETENLPVSIWQGKWGYFLNLEVHCELTPEALSEWQTKVYYDLIEAYDKLKADADAKINGFDLSTPSLPPEKKREVIRTELKKEAIRTMFRCNPFWVNDQYQVGIEYKPNCRTDGPSAEKVRFLETVFDWRNMTYEFYPYFYANKTQWNKILDLEDDDPHFEAFLKAPYVTIHIPVHRDNLKEIAACNFIINNAIGNYETIPEGLEGLLEELKKEAASQFTYDLDGNPLPMPKTTVDLGIFSIPTSLVILECGNQDGVKPIGFPQEEAPDPDVVIPKQYSPAIIADNCTNP